MGFVRGQIPMPAGNTSQPVTPPPLSLIDSPAQSQPSLPAPTSTQNSAPAPQQDKPFGSGLDWSPPKTPAKDPLAVDPNELVSTHLRNVMDKEGSLMKLAATEGKQYANKRGLINSSIAAGSVGDSVIRQALPIAQGDAAPYQQKALQISDAALRGQLVDQEAKQALQSDLIKQFESQAWEIKTDNKFAQNRQKQYESNENMLASRLNMIERMSALNLDRFVPQGTSTAVR